MISMIEKKFFETLEKRLKKEYETSVYDKDFISFEQFVEEEIEEIINDFFKLRSDLENHTHDIENTQAEGYNPNYVTTYVRLNRY